jgi:hypothetical protein
MSSFTFNSRVRVLAMVVVLACAALPVAAQWATSGATVYNNPQTLVWIGNGTVQVPLHNLQVGGSAVFGGEGSSYGAARFVIGASHADFGIVGYNTRPTNTFGQYNYYGADSASQIYFYDGGFRFRIAPVGVGGNAITFSEPFTISKTGLVTVANSLNVGGDVNVTGNIAAKYQDVAEWVPSASDLEVGTVVVLDPSASNHVMAASRAYDTTVAGVVSAKPGLILGEASADKEMIATTGRVKVKVDATAGSIKIGDLLVSSPEKGYAMKSSPVNVGGAEFHRPGTIIGKALEALPNGKGEILVLLSLQ